MTCDPGNPNFITDYSERAGALSIYQTWNEKTGKIDLIATGAMSASRATGRTIRPVYSSERPDPYTPIIVIED